MVEQCGPIQRRVKLDDGMEVILPADAILYPVIKPGDDVRIEDITLGGCFN